MNGYSPYDFGYDVRQVFTVAWTPSTVELNRKLRVLWEQHVYWTRLAVNSIVGNLPDKDETIKRASSESHRFCSRP